MLLLFALVFSACTTQDPEGFEIKVKLTNSNRQTIYLEELTSTAVLVKDTVKIDKNGEFTFTGQIPEIGFYRLRLDQNNFINIVLDKYDNIQITADAKNLYYTYKIKSSENNQLLYQLNDYLKKFNFKIDSLRRVLQSFQFSLPTGQAGPKIDSVNNALTAEYNRIMLNKTNFIRNFIDNNFNSFVVLQPEIGSVP